MLPAIRKLLTGVIFYCASPSRQTRRRPPCHAKQHRIPPPSTATCRTDYAKSVLSSALTASFAPANKTRVQAFRRTATCAARPDHLRRFRHPAACSRSQTTVRQTQKKAPKRLFPFTHSTSMAFNVRLSAQLLLGSSKVLLTCLTGNKQSVLVRCARR